MNCTSARATFPALLDHRTTATEHLEARTHLASCPDCQREFAELSRTLTALDTMPAPTPSPRLRQNFYAMLEEEKNSAASVRVAAERDRRVRRISLWGWVLSPLAAAALVALGFHVGQRQAPPAAAPAPSSEVAAMRNELKELRQLVGISILQQQRGPVSSRLQEVLAAAKSDQPTEKTLTDLVNALAFDPSVNVRLRALEALFPHAENKLVSDGVLTALPREQDPLVLVELIDFLAASGNRDAAPELEKMTQNEAIDRSVRDAARRALAQL
ncbi:MAG: HEAT repeat domain-containing protein [Verrucomicrobia bacterium]|nr:HEAT repeat domain-containing protein [Verrucomicrobiota bacterium]